MKRLTFPSSTHLVTITIHGDLFCHTIRHISGAELVLGPEQAIYWSVLLYP